MLRMIYFFAVVGFCAHMHASNYIGNGYIETIVSATEQPDSSPLTIFEVCARKDWDGLDSLLAAGADLEIYNQDGMCPLDVAARANFRYAARKLLEKTTFGIGSAYAYVATKKSGIENYDHVRDLLASSILQAPESEVEFARNMISTAIELKEQIIRSAEQTLKNEKIYLERTIVNLKAQLELSPDDAQLKERLGRTESAINNSNIPQLIIMHKNLCKIMYIDLERLPNFKNQ